ncbi:SDR family NAD(P)-dependent oxidoreductase [Actinoplanes sp. NBRC 103695]|uniref:SDR family NAD(P)-dependent oxidoreductase n=1 Tax=Actinoplanes sp. NBRC 103695 TaxID=3032202 RepID=UPI002553727C|nr:SDR family NAD(P)-dependent oxidoreductase [Actinoplanes sp. NBRC 103695]
MDDAIALIIGADSALGRAVCRELGRHGFYVVLTARDGRRAVETAVRLRADGIGTTGLELDLVDPSAIHDVTEHLRKRFGYLDVLITNETPYLGHTMLSEAMAHIDGTRTLLQRALPLLRRSPTPRIVNVSAEGGAAPLDHTHQVLTVSIAMQNPGTALLVNTVETGRPESHPDHEDDVHAPTAAQAARDVAWAALLPPGGPTGSLILRRHPSADAATAKHH